MAHGFPFCPFTDSLLAPDLAVHMCLLHPRKTFFCMSYAEHFVVSQWWPAVHMQGNNIPLTWSAPAAKPPAGEPIPVALVEYANNWVQVTCWICTLFS